MAGLTSIFTEHSDKYIYIYQCYMVVLCLLGTKNMLIYETRGYNYNNLPNSNFNNLQLLYYLEIYVLSVLNYANKIIKTKLLMADRPK